jgi:hypothetical protein
MRRFQIATVLTPDGPEVDMVNLTLKGIPETLYERLRESAKANRRSVNQEAIARLSDSLLVRRSTPDETIARLDALHGRLKLKPLSSSQIRRAIREGRS